MKKMILRAVLGSMFIALFSLTAANAGSFYKPAYLPSSEVNVTVVPLSYEGMWDMDKNFYRWVLPYEQRYNYYKGALISSIWQSRSNPCDFYLVLAMGVSEDDVAINFTTYYLGPIPKSNGAYQVNTFNAAYRFNVAHKTQIYSGEYWYEKDEFGYEMMGYTEEMVWEKWMFEAYDLPFDGEYPGIDGNY